MDHVNDKPEDRQGEGGKSAATGTGPAQPWDKQGCGPDRVEADPPRKASGVSKSGDRKVDQDDEDRLEDALEQTFPASDPVSATQISRPGKPPRKDR